MKPLEKKSRTISLFIYVLLLPVAIANAHPAWGIVVDEHGTIFFADILNCNTGCVWKIDLNGRLSKLLSNQHTHAIFLDPDGNLWGTHHEYISRSDEWENQLWKLNPAGNKTLVIPPTRNPSRFGGTNFAIDSKGNIYFDHQKRIIRRMPDGNSIIIAGGAGEMKDGEGSAAGFSRIITMTMGPDQSIYITDVDAVRKVSLEGNVTTLATGLIDENPENPPYREASHNLLYGLTISPDGLIYVANSGSRILMKIAQNGEVSTIYQSEAPWYPTGMAIYGSSFYFLEVGFVPGSGHIGPRVMVQNQDGKVSTLAVVSE